MGFFIYIYTFFLGLFGNPNAPVDHHTNLQSQMVTPVEQASITNNDRKNVTHGHSVAQIQGEIIILDDTHFKPHLGHRE